ncbi:peptidoglycan-binding protein LysM [Aureivirga sp. CE67]|uniref:peptidoglycan-binding protein LysM n=1 Tax=Aureivirga sp. CE67 TaxID=1788983 RepID=UPI0018C8F8E8|nr:peptidoglycan-binding protein LysM [Aureivirga sp. CE67]
MRRKTLYVLFLLFFSMMYGRPAFFITDSDLNDKVFKEKETGTKMVTVLSEDEVKNFIEIPYLGKSFIGFREAIAFKESRGNYNMVNSLGYVGKYQFGKTALKHFKINDTQKFLNDPVLQEKAFIALCSVNKWILRKEIKQWVGKKVNGIEVTESGILAAAHLGGAGNVKKYLRSRGSNNFKDAYGTSIYVYMKKFAGYDTSNIETIRKPVI